MSKKEILIKLSEAVKEGDENAANAAAKEALNANIDPLEAIDKGLSAGMAFIGNQFEEGLIFLPNILLAADAMIAGMEVLTKKLPKEKVKKPVGSIVIGTVEGDIHDIGKNLVATMLMGSGFTVHDLGRDVPIGDFAKKAREVKGDIIAVSALMSTTMWNQKRVVEDVKESGLKARVLIGGACVTDRWAKKIGTFYAPNAGAAVRTVKKMIG
jgi:trimethylamine corrinoid protein